MGKILKVPVGEDWYFGYIYLTTNLINNKKYIGRKKGYFNPKYFGSGTLIKKALSKYGTDNFSIEILQKAYSFEELIKLEEYYVSLHNAVDDQNYYNLEAGGLGAGQGFKGRKHTEKAIDILRSKNLGANNKFFNKHHTEESKNKAVNTRKSHDPNYGKNLDGRYYYRQKLREQQLEIFGYTNKRLPRVILTNEEVSRIKLLPEDERYNEVIKIKDIRVPHRVYQRGAQSGEMRIINKEPKYARGYKLSKDGKIIYGTLCGSQRGKKQPDNILDILKQKIEQGKSPYDTNSKPVYQYTLSKELIKIWPSMKLLKEEGYNHKGVKRCCFGETSSYKEYIWSYSPLGGDVTCPQ